VSDEHFQKFDEEPIVPLEVQQFVLERRFHCAARGADHDA
jgi:hypothetical protein